MAWTYCENCHRGTSYPTPQETLMEERNCSECGAVEILRGDELKDELLVEMYNDIQEIKKSIVMLNSSTNSLRNVTLPLTQLGNKIT